jgi:hypothetical protein
MATLRLLHRLAEITPGSRERSPRRASTRIPLCDTAAMAACCCCGVTLATREPLMAGTRVSSPRWVAIVGCSRFSFAFHRRAEPEYPQSQSKCAHSGIHTSSYDTCSAVGSLLRQKSSLASLACPSPPELSVRGVSVSRISSLGSCSVPRLVGRGRVFTAFVRCCPCISGPQGSDPSDSLRCIVDANRCRHRFVGARDDIPRCP